MNDSGILVTTDFSELSNKAFEAANVLAKNLGKSVTPFHVFRTDDEAYKPKLKELVQRKKVLQQKLDNTAKRYINEEYLNPGKMVQGYPVPSILEAAKKFDMIVMSSHGRTGFNRLFLGSVAEKVLRLSKKPVLIVEEESNIAPIKKILVTTDFSPVSEAAFPWAKELAIASEAEIDVVNVVSVEQSSILGIENKDSVNKILSETEEKLEDLIDKHFSEIKSSVNKKVIHSKKSVHHKITELVDSSDYNLIVMATVGHTGLGYLLLGSTTASLVRQVETGVLVVHPDHQ